MIVKNLFFTWGQEGCCFLNEELEKHFFSFFLPERADYGDMTFIRNKWKKRKHFVKSCKNSKNVCKYEIFYYINKMKILNVKFIISYYWICILNGNSVIDLYIVEPLSFVPLTLHFLHILFFKFGPLKFLIIIMLKNPAYFTLLLFCFPA